MKMDHHCPWINNCVGHRNHAAFVRFLFHVTIGCSHALYVQALCLYRTIFGRKYWLYRRVMPYGRLALTANLLCAGLTMGVTVAVGLLLVTQLMNIKRNKTEIELWIVNKARSTRTRSHPFRFPYDLGWKRNFKSVLWTQEGDGITWNVRDDCHQYTLTIEQIEQKKLKRDRTYPYDVITSYNGKRDHFGICFGCRVVFSCPNPDEPRLRVKKGDRIMVTRIRRHWVYGNKVLGHLVENGFSDTSRPYQYSKERGWLPKICAVPVHKRTWEKVVQTDRSIRTMYMFCYRPSLSLPYMYIIRICKGLLWNRSCTCIDGKKWQDYANNLWVLGKGWKEYNSSGNGLFLRFPVLCWVECNGPLLTKSYSWMYAYVLVCTVRYKSWYIWVLVGCNHWSQTTALIN